MRILLWIGNEPNQKALANKVHALYPLDGIITETKIGRRKLTLKKVVTKVIEKILCSSVGKAWFDMLNFYNSKYTTYPEGVQLLDVENINSEEAYEFSSKIRPDLIIVSGTRLVKQKMLSIQPRIGILNLHTGLSPYIKGGPNCTNWCIATNQLHLIGNTVMWIDAGIDSGNILTTEHVDFNGEETLLDVHIKVMEHAHSLYLKAIESLTHGKTSNVSQELICKGTTYYTREWGLKEKMNLIRNFKKFGRSINSTEMQKKREKIITINI